MRGTKAALWRFIAAVTVVLSAVTVMQPTAAAEYRKWTKKLAPGVWYTVIRDPKGPWRIRYVKIGLDKPSTIDVALAQDRLPGFERTSSIAQRHGALVAINGDYARSSGRPVFTFAEDGELAQTELTYGRNFALDTAEATGFFGHPPERWIANVAMDDGQQFPVKWFNTYYDDTEKKVAAFSPVAGSDAVPPSSTACSARLQPMEAFRINPSTGASEARHFVEKVRCDDTLGRRGGTVISAPAWWATGQAIALLTYGAEGTLSWTLGWPNVMDTIGGNPLLIKDGFINEDVYGSTPFFKRHPRTGVGLTADNKLLFVIVDGRRPKYSVGMTPSEFAELFESLGAISALNLDGGGSTTMAINGEVVNRPSDKQGERGVSSALMVLEGADPGEYVEPPSGGMLPAPLPTLASDETWARIVEDPASTGGLADALLRQGLNLPPALTRAALEFRR